MAVSGRIRVTDGTVDGAVEAIDVGEGLMRKVARFQVAPDDLDVVQLGGVFGQPFDGEPVGALGERRPAGLAEVDGTIVEDQDDWLGRRPGSGALRGGRAPANAR
jgi:hypothetical protein